MTRFPLSGCVGCRSAYGTTAVPPHVETPLKHWAIVYAEFPAVFFARTR